MCSCNCNRPSNKLISEVTMSHACLRWVGGWQAPTDFYELRASALSPSRRDSRQRRSGAFSARKVLPTMTTPIVCHTTLKFYSPLL